MLKSCDVFNFNDEIKEVFRQLKEAIDKLVKEIQKFFADTIDTDEYTGEYEDTKKKVSKYNLNKSKYTRENNYYKNQFRLSKRHVCIRNKYKR